MKAFYIFLIASQISLMGCISAGIHKDSVNMIFLFLLYALNVWYLLKERFDNGR